MYRPVNQDVVPVDARVQLREPGQPQDGEPCEQREDADPGHRTVVVEHAPRLQQRGGVDIDPDGGFRDLPPRPDEFVGDDLADAAQRDPFGAARDRLLHGYRLAGRDPGGDGGVDVTAVEKLQSKYGLKVTTHPPKIPYKETIRKSGKQHWPPQAPIRRAWPVRRCAYRDHVRCRAAPDLSSRITSRAAWCRAIHSLGGKRRDRLSEIRPAWFSGGRSGGGAGGWLLSFGGFIRRRVSDRSAHRHAGRHAQLRAGAAGADHARENPCAERRHLEGQCGGERAGAAS